MIQSMRSYIRYFESIRQRTLTFAQAIPPNQIDWSPKEGEFTCGEILRHLAAIETMTAGVVETGTWPAYPGHGRSVAPSLEDILAYMQSTHKQAMDKLATLPDTILYVPRPAIGGRPLKAWRLLMAMVEHEVHHRSQLASTLLLMGEEPPQLYGLQLQDVINFSSFGGED